MNISNEKQNTFSHNSLVEGLQSFSSVISILDKATNESEEKLVAEKLLEFTKLLQDSGHDVSELNKRLSQCDCLGKRIFCVMSVIALNCSEFLKTLACFHAQDEEQVDTLYSEKEKEHLSQILEFIVLNGLILHLDFQISILVTKSSQPCLSSKQDFWNVSRNLFCCGADITIRNLLVSKHLLPFLAAFIQLSYSPAYRKLLSLDDTNIARKSLSAIIVKWCQLKDVVKCLFILQGSSSRCNPAWVAKVCGSLLSKCLLRENGVAAVVTTLLATLGSYTSLLKKIEISSKILSTPPHVSSQEEYYTNICNQILSLFQLGKLQNSRTDSEKLFIQILVATIFSLFKRSSGLSSQCFFNKVFLPMNAFYDDISDIGDCIAAENCKNVNSCIEILSNLFLLFKHPDQEEACGVVLLPHFNALFVLYCWSRDRVDHIRTLLKQLLIKCLEQHDSNVAAGLLLSFCGIVDENVQKILTVVKKIKDNIEVAIDENNDVVIVQRGNISLRTPEEVIDAQNKKMAAIMEIASASKIEKILSEMFIMLCKHIENVSQSEDYRTNPHDLLTAEETASLHLHHGESRLLAYALLTTLCEECDSKDLLADIDQITSFIKVLLTRISSADCDSDHLEINKESLKLCYAVLGLCLMDVESKPGSLSSLVPLLQKLSTSSHLCREDKEIASDLAIAIATYGACCDVAVDGYSQTLLDQIKNLETKYSESQKDVSPKSQTSQKITSENASSHVEEKGGKSPTLKHPQCDLKPAQSVRPFAVQNKRASAAASNSINEAIESIYDSCPSNRAAGFRYIADSMKKNIKEATDRSEKLSEILLEGLIKENDTFAYLSAIQAVVETIDRAPMISKDSRTLFACLIEEYGKCIQSKESDVEIKVLKLGEVLVRLIGKLGELADFQRSKLLPILFRGSRDVRGPIRCSCISNLAEICPLLRHKLSTFQYELRECVCGTVLHDEDSTVRRAAVHLMRKLIDSLQSDMLHIFSDSMKKFYSAMKHCYEKDGDHVVQLHAQLALEGLDDVMRDVMFNEPQRKNKTLQKKITVLS